MSCKEISAYLLSLRGIPDANQQICVQSNAGATATDKMTTAIVSLCPTLLPSEVLFLFGFHS